MTLTNRRLTVRTSDGACELSADVPDGVDLADAEIELSAELARVIEARRQRGEASRRLLEGWKNSSPASAAAERARRISQMSETEFAQLLKTMQAKQ